jgi:hypothetical protein
MLHPNITLLLSCVVIVGFGSLRVLLMTKISVFKKIFVQKTCKTIILDSKIEHSLNMNQTSIKELDMLFVAARSIFLESFKVFGGFLHQGRIIGHFKVSGGRSLD